jgi:hypothetical protein
MAETQSTTTTTTEATAPTGDIKVFIDAFNKDFDAELKKLVDTQQNYKNVYADAIKITTPKEGPWPNDPKVVTIGDLFKYTFPDIESDKVVQPPDYELGDSPEGDKWENRKGWEKDLKYSKDEKIKKMYSTIFSGIKSNKNIKKYQELKKPGVTNPSLWSPGQYYFDVFMNNFVGSRETKPSSFLKDPYQSITDDKLSVIESGKNDFLEFTDAIYSLSDMIVYTTDINIGLKEKEDKSSLFPSLQTQYKSGLWSELVPKKYENDQFYKDKEFDSRRGDFDSGQPKKFIGYYEHILLYKAFIQAGDNYKSVVLPFRNPETPPPGPIVNTRPIVNLPQEIGYTFNVEKKDSFVIVGGSMSGVEFTIVPNDGTQYIIEVPDDLSDADEPLDEEYVDDEFAGTEEEMVEAQAAYAIESGLDGFNYRPITSYASSSTETSPVSTSTPSKKSNGNGAGTWQKAVEALPDSVTFKARVEKFAAQYNTTADQFYRVMYAESRIRPWALNKNGGASGLIQFMPSTAKGLGTTTEYIRSLNATQQMEFVEKYFTRAGLKKGATVYDMYALVFFPIIVGKSDDWVIQTKNLSAQLVSKSNPAIARAAGKSAGTPLNVSDFKRYVDSIS